MANIYWTIVLIFLLLKVDDSRGSAVDNGPFKMDLPMLRRYPYVTRIMIVGKFGDTSYQYCMGIYLGKKFVLTIATCIKSYVLNPERIAVCMGEVELNPPWNCQMAWGRAERIDIRDEFGVIIMHDRMNHGQFVQPSYIESIPEKDITHAITAGKKCITMGWSLANAKDGDDYKHILRYANLTIENDQSNGCLVNNTALICAGLGTMQGCQSELGAPLICSGRLVGLLVNGTMPKCSNQPGRVHFLNVYSQIYSIMNSKKMLRDDVIARQIQTQSVAISIVLNYIFYALSVSVLLL